MPKHRRAGASAGRSLRRATELLLEGFGAALFCGGHERRLRQ